jgi:serine protease Do
VPRAAQLAVGLALGAALGFAAARLWPGAGPEPGEPGLPGARVGSPVTSAPSEPGGPEWQSHFARLVKRVAPGVVNVHTSRTLTRTFTPGFPFPDLGRFFGGTPEPEEERYTVPSLGSGFVISADGLIVTNDHVVNGVDRISVKFSDGQVADAAVVGRDPKTDIALVRVALEGLQPLELGDSDDVEPGDWVVAVGNPFGLDHTVTVGIVSAKGREIGTGPYDDYIQTDAAINPGNSGGPLLDLEGRVVGINTAINPRANTIGFAVPINIAKDILPQLESKGVVTRGWLGASVQPISPELAEFFGPGSALVADVTPGGPAERGGLRRGDVVVSIDGKAIQEIRELPRAVSKAPVGSTVALGIVRDGREVTLHIEVEELADEVTLARPAARIGGMRDFGLEVEDPSDAVRRRLRMPERGGVVISHVEAGSAAEAAGLQRGDALLELDRQPILDAAQLDAVLDRGPGSVLLLVQRGGQTVYVALHRG